MTFIINYVHVIVKSNDFIDESYVNQVNIDIAYVSTPVWSRRLN